MKITAEMKKEILNKIDELDDAFELGAYTGIRVQEVPFELGEIDHCSRVWIDGDETDEELDGICVTKPEHMSSNEYYGEYAAIITGDLVEYGEDLGEMILTNARVVAIIR